MVSAALAFTPSAQAQVAAAGMMLPASIAAVAIASCQFPENSGGSHSLASNGPSHSKASAIIGNGGNMSALERMIHAQSGQPVADTAYTATAVAAPPALTFGLSQCAGQFGPPLPNIKPAAILSAPTTDFLASKRISIGQTSFENDWRRVKNGHVSTSWAKRRLGSGERTDEELVQAVNAYANHTIRFAEDRELWGKADYWANAKTTFRLGKGDCEDIAIAKLQMLAAMGIKREDMVLTLAKDLIRRVDHAVLIVRLNGNFVMLDNTTDSLIDASVSQGYRPVLSFGNDQSWLHGF
jgi:predicted transglutaminase-like cysteine proteinase